MESISITLVGWQSILAWLLLSAIGSFIGCFVFVKIFEWNKVTFRTKLKTTLDISSEDLYRVLNRKEVSVKESFRTNQPTPEAGSKKC